MYSFSIASSFPVEFRITVESQMKFELLSIFNLKCVHHIIRQESVSCVSTFIYIHVT